MFQDYAYDENGNRLWVKDSGGAYLQDPDYDPNSNRINERDPLDPITLDLAGNTLHDDGKGLYLTYDDRGRMSKAEVGPVSEEEYRYDGFGRRVMSFTNPGGKWTKRAFQYGLNGELIWESKIDWIGTTRVDTAYVWLNGVPVAQIARETLCIGACGSTDTITYIHPDHLGTPRIGTKEGSQTISWRWLSDAFGQGAAETDPDGDGTQVDIRLRFPGQYYDSLTGLHYNYYRTYDPATGRYLESDPIGLNGGLNTYSYVSNMPTMRVDPFGLFGLAGHSQARLEQARRDGRAGSPPPISGSIGAGGAWHGGPVGVAADSGVAFGEDGAICLYSRRCGTFGMGAFATLGISGSGATGRLCSGNYKTFGAAGGGGAAGAGGSSLEYSPDANGLSGARGFGGIGVGGFGGFIECIYTLICFNESDSCNACGAE